MKNSREPLRQFDLIVYYHLHFHLPGQNLADRLKAEESLLTGNLLQVMATSQMKVILSLFAKWENFVLQESEIKPENTEYTSGYRNIFRDGETQWLCKKKIRNFVYLKAIL